MTTLKYEREKKQKKAVPLAFEHPDYTMTRSMPSAKRFSSKELRGPEYVTLNCSPAEQLAQRREYGLIKEINHPDAMGNLLTAICQGSITQKLCSRV